MLQGRLLWCAAVLFAPSQEQRSGGQGNRGAPDAGAGVDVDTVNTNPMDGLSNEQVGAQAVPLTPEQARARGMTADTSIHLENLGPRDSFPTGTNAGATPSPDTTGVPRDTTGGAP
jgi:hypothetical protein